VTKLSCLDAFIATENKNWEEITKEYEKILKAFQK